MMTTENPPPAPPDQPPPDPARRIYKIIVATLLVIMGIELVWVLIEGQWLTALLVTVIMGIMGAPFVFPIRLPINIPAEFSALAVVFIFAALFLGEIQDFYERIWWWDLALHTTSGLLLGIMGFLLVYVLNKNERVDLYMRPNFVAIFAFTFAVAAGVVWEIFEFGADQIFSMNMQKADKAGLSDTMWDLIVDTLSALLISLLGWWYMKREEVSLFEILIQRFIKRNRRFFRY
jgi:hypothetical protein